RPPSPPLFPYTTLFRSQLWGLLWGIFVFGELHGRPSSTYLQVVGGSLLMMLGVAAVAFSSASGEEQARWKEAAAREARRYGVARDRKSTRLNSSHVEIS